MSRSRALLALIIGLALLVLCAGGAVAFDLVNAATGRAGTITVTACTRDNGARKPQYDCTGTFATTDGTERRDDVRFTLTYQEDPGGRLPATLNGDTVNRSSPGNTVTGALVAVAGLAGIVVLIVVRRRLR